MAPSLQGLIDFVLNEIALCGSQGGTLPGVLQSIETFYRSAGKDANQRQQTVDRPFQVKVWSWLTRDPEVSVGKDRELNHLSLDEVEELDKQESLEAEEAASDQDQQPAKTVSYVRIFVSNERTWLAIAGHEPDESKIPKAEWGLLSIIASYKSKGIPQTELVRVSGQDKRSVPKRTDALAAKGYIEKRAVQVKAARTSLCTLRRFLQQPTDIPSDEQAPSVSGDKTLIDFDVFTSNLFEILKKFGIISRNDLKRALGFNDRWRWRILSRALRKFERIGVLKRVSAESQYGRFHPCVMLVREPTERDMEKFHEFTRISMIKDEEGAELDEDMEMETTEKKTPVADNDAVVEETPVADKDAVVVKTEENVVDAGRIVPCWTPDRNLNNQIFDVIDKTGTIGITNLDLNRILFGTYYRRPSESALHRLVNCWQLSQPLHLRHLAIVRDTALKKTVTYYIHYSARNFAKLVESGQAVWEAVEYSGKGRPNDIPVPPVDAKPQLDQYGLPSGIPQRLLNNGNASLFEGIASCRPSNYLLSSSDPMPIQRPDGGYTIQSGLVKSSTGTPLSSPIRVRRQGRPLGALDRSARVRAARGSSTSATPDKKVVELPPEAEFITPRTVKAKRKNLEGLSKKERFEAMGMDETWVEYKALLMDRPTPGVYVTPEGKRRPAGKKQGRPPKSRLAIFKSDKLRSFPWFVREQGDSDVEQTKALESPAAPAAHEDALPRPGPAVADSEDLATSSMVEDIHISARRAKRAQAALDHPSSPTPGAGPDSSRPYRGRLNKRPRLDINVPDATVSADSEGTLPDIVVHRAAEEPVPVTGKTKKDAVHPLDSEQVHQTAPKRRRIRSPERISVSGPSQAPAGQPEIPSASPMTPLAEDVSMQRTPSAAPETPGAPVEKVHPTGDKGGSIGLLRRRIVMEIVEKAGGAYPSGTEIWYPFATAWLKMNRKEKPDLRTIKTAIKHLVDTGKLKQFTFSGKDSRGMMTTKTILAKPEMSPDDPLIKDMQKKVLATDRRDPVVSYSPHVETDPTLTKSGGTPMVQRFHLPVVPGKTVQLHEKPAAVRNEEKRRERMIHKALLEQMAGDTVDFDGDEPGRARRLMTILRPSDQGPSARTQTSIARPSTRPRGRPRVPLRAVALIAAFAMFMDPGQSFHSSTGTFGTGLLPGTRRPRGPTKKPLGNISERLEELAQMARETEDPWSTANKILRWELQHEGIFDAILENQPYIEQAIPDHTFRAAPIAGKIRFDTDQPAPEPPPVGVPMTTRYRNLLPRAPPQPVPRRLDRVETALPARKEVEPEAMRGPFRRQRHQPQLPEHLLRKLIVAIVAVRVLAGGAEGKLCDWNLVAAAFPSEDRIYIQEQAKRVLTRNRLQIIKMQRDFQERFIEAYAKDQVPRIDYDHLEQYNWPAVIEWANIELEVSTSDKVPSLPATRGQFDSIFELREEPITTGDELYGTTSSISVISKTKTATRVPFAVPLERKEADRPGPRKAELARLEVAKSWVRANVVTPEQDYRPEEARRLLDRFGEPLINSAVQSLLVDRVIGNRNRGRVTPGRNFDITEHLLQQINRKRTIESTMLRRAAYFKTTVLDPKLKDDGICEVNYAADDGDILALINLAATGRISLQPRDPPQDKFGLTDGGYITRKMDRSRVRFAIDIRPLPGYVYGDPIQERASSLAPPAPPPSTEPGLPPKIPLWIGIHGQLVPQIWDMAVASVIGCVALRQGLSAGMICRMIRPALNTWETELLLQWLAQVGVVGRDGSDESAGWKVKEWWWLILPSH